MAEFVTTEKDPITLLDHLNLAAAFLKKKNIPSARLEAEVLLAAVLKVDRIFLYTHFDRPLSRDEKSSYRALVIRRSDGTPTAYLTGEKEFYGRLFAVSPAVLIPRPETEGVVETVLNLAPQIATEKPLVADLGSGSGCIIVSILAEDPKISGVAVDISIEALKITRANAQRHEVADRLWLVEGDFSAPLADRSCDVVVANPPYVSSSQMAVLPPEVKREPSLALEGGNDGLDAVRHLITDLPRVLKPAGRAVIEIGEDQSEPVSSFLENGPFEEVTVLPDLAGKDRIVTFRRR